MINSISFVINSGHMTCLSEYKKKKKKKKKKDHFTNTLTYRRFNVHEYMSLTVPIILAEAVLHVTIARPIYMYNIYFYLLSN